MEEIRINEDNYYPEHTFRKDLVQTLKRIADAQEGMLAIAAEARYERLKLAEDMRAKFRAGFAGNEDLK